MAKIKPKTLKPKTREKVDEWKRTLAGLAEHLRTLAVDIDGFPEQGDKKSVDDALYDACQEVFTAKRAIENAAILLNEIEADHER